MRRPARRCRQRRAACARRRPAQRAAARTNHSAAFLTPAAVRPSASPPSSAPPSRRFAFALCSFPAVPSAHHSPSALPPPTAPPSRRFAFALRSFPNAPLPAPITAPLSCRPPAHRRPHPRTHRVVSHSPFAASRRAACAHRRSSQRIAALIRAPIASFRIRSSQLPTAPSAHHSPSALPPPTTPPSHRFAFALRSFSTAPLSRRPPQHAFAVRALIRNPRHSPPISMPLFEARFAGRIFQPPKTENRAVTFIPARNRSVCRLRTPAPGRRTGRATCARSAADRPPD